MSASWRHLPTAQKWVATHTDRHHHISLHYARAASLIFFSPFLGRHPNSAATSGNQPSIARARYDQFLVALIYGLDAQSFFLVLLFSVLFSFPPLRKRGFPKSDKLGCVSHGKRPIDPFKDRFQRTFCLFSTCISCRQSRTNTRATRNGWPRHWRRPSSCRPICSIHAVLWPRLPSF